MKEREEAQAAAKTAAAAIALPRLMMAGPEAAGCEAQAAASSAAEG